MSGIVITTGNHEIVSKDSYNYLQYNPLPNMDGVISSKTYSNDRELISMLNMEAWNMFGVKTIFYKVSYDAKYDKVFGEDGNRIVNSEYSIMTYFQLPKENKVWSTFGIDGVNDVSIFTSKEHFRYKTQDEIPQIGDILLTQNNNMFYEITEVKEESPTFLLSKQYVWEFVCRRVKVESDISISVSLSASPISKIYKVKDVLDITTDVDKEKFDILYEPISGESHSLDPFGSWT